MNDLSKFSDKDIIDILSSNAEEELKKRGYEYGWYKKETYAGVIYILVNPAFNNLVKIGYADDVTKRMKTFNSNSGLPAPYHCYAVYKVKKRLDDLKFHSLLDMLDPTLRYTPNREFYKMDGKKAYDILSAIAQLNGDEDNLIKDPFSDDFFKQGNNSNPQTAVPASAAVSKSSKKGPLRFNMIGIMPGSTLVFTKDNSITCVTKDDQNHVIYNGKIYSLSALASELLNAKNAVQGGLFFMYNGEVLTERRKRLGV